MPTGELFIHNLQHSDELQSFRCRCMHKLTRQVVISSPARLRVNGNILLFLCGSCNIFY